MNIYRPPPLFLQHQMLLCPPEDRFETEGLFIEKTSVVVVWPGYHLCMKNIRRPECGDRFLSIFDGLWEA